MKTPEEWMDACNQTFIFTEGMIELIQLDALNDVREWFSLSNDGFLLRMGECSKQEIMTCRAMLRAILGAAKEPNLSNPSDIERYLMDVMPKAEEYAAKRTMERTSPWITLGKTEQPKQ